MPGEPSLNDAYRDCPTYLEHGACPCSTGYPASCDAPSVARYAGDASSVRLLGQHLDPNEGNGGFTMVERRAVTMHLARYYKLLRELAEPRVGKHFVDA